MTDCESDCAKFSSMKLAGNGFHQAEIIPPLSLVNVEPNEPSFVLVHSRVRKRGQL